MLLFTGIWVNIWKIIFNKIKINIYIFCLSTFWQLHKLAEVSLTGNTICLPPDKYCQITRLNLPLNITLNCIWYEPPQHFCIHSLVWYCRIKTQIYHIYCKLPDKARRDHKLFWLSETLPYRQMTLCEAITRNFKIQY